jgi:hypothetical protein
MREAVGRIVADNRIGGPVDIGFILHGKAADRAMLSPDADAHPVVSA